MGKYGPEEGKNTEGEVGSNLLDGNDWVDPNLVSFKIKARKGEVIAESKEVGPEWGGWEKAPATQKGVYAKRPLG